MTAYLLSYYSAFWFSYSTTIFMEKGRKGRNLALDLTYYFLDPSWDTLSYVGQDFFPSFPSSPSYPFRIYPIFSSYPKNNNDKIIIIITNNNKH